MAITHETIWFFPVAGGGTGGGQFLQVPGLDAVNVYWAFNNYPSGAAAAYVSYRLVKSDTITTSSGAGHIGAAYVHWEWISHQDCESLPSVTFGNKLIMGIPFGSRVPTVNDPDVGDQAWYPPFNCAEASVKFRVNDIERFSGIWLTVANQDFTVKIGEGSNLRTVFGTELEDWRVATSGKLEFGQEDTLIDNLRAVLTLQGADTPSGIPVQTTGVTSVDVEWFAVRLYHET